MQMIDAVTQTVDTWHQQFQQIMVHKDAILANLNLPLDAPRSVYYKPTLENYVDEFFDYILSSADIYNNSLKTYRQESNLTNPADINAQSIANFYQVWQPILNKLQELMDDLVLLIYTFNLNKFELDGSEVIF